ncbi:peptidoglycan-associated lipoprotein Pal [Belnapia sp. F-4-1]|uniref:peptidoglycan-associated lipoprotein Pal n=1 Tax=Belnapia sp. F-4-1 TaxID=1545443 RepID=UPI0005BAC1C9|nr:peptidoglycan-associated lipoprotein Pal [Belnapia sp. F-4-1]
MLIRTFAALAAMALLAGCSSDSDQNAAATGQGGGSSLGAANQGGLGGPGGGRGGANARPGSQEDLAANVGDRVYFVTDSSTVGADQRPVLERQAAWLQQYRQVTVMVEGHADERGTREYNLALGQRRANAARDVLVSQGVAGTRITTISFGKDRPAALGSDQQAWAQNRRAVTTVR